MTSAASSALRTENVCTLVERQVDATPEATALIDGEERVSYQSLWQRAMAISLQLQAKALKPDEPVGIVLHRHRDLVASILGIWHAGGAYIPIDPEDPASRNAHILQIAHCRLVLSDVQAIAAQQDLFDGTPDMEVIDLTHLSVTAARIDPLFAAPSALAYIIFTSGSTGKPKGVEVEQSSVVHFLVSMRNILRFSANDRFLATTSTGFDISVAELLLPLICGGSILLRHRTLWLEPVELATQIERFRATVVQAVPSSWTTALAALPAFPRLRVAISGGEAITPQLALRLARISEEAWNFYGPTETTVWATARRLPSIEDDLPSAGSRIGYPLNGVTAVVIDERGQPPAPGAPGELLIGGVLVARGYHRQPELTAERFINHEGTRYFRTGDIASMASDGSIICYGRADEQLKIRGVRIEPGEVEAVMQSLPGIRSAAVTWLAAGDSSRILVAVYVAAQEQSPSTESIVASIAHRLPSQMVPARILRIDRLPLTSNGKVDRSAIRSLFEHEAGQESRTDDLPRSDTEKSIAATWCRILQRSNVSRSDHFFSIGGDSLAAVRVITSIESAFGLRLSIRSLFEAPTLTAFAMHVDRCLIDRHSAAGREFVFELAHVAGSRPVFFSDLDVRMVTLGNWKPPATLHAVNRWAQLDEFLQVSTLEALARAQLAGIRTRQSMGPYRLAGIGFGGLLALEIARQLERLGETVEMLVLIHPMTPSQTVTTDGLSAHTAGGPPQSSRSERSRARQLLWQGQAWVQYQLAHLRGQNRNPLADALFPKKYWPSYWYHSRTLARQHVSRTFSGPAVLIGSPDPGAMELWHRLLPALEVLTTSREQLDEASRLDEWRKLLERVVMQIEKQAKS